MGAPGKPRLGLSPALARVLAVCAAGLVAPAAATAQSSEIQKTGPQQASGQTEIRKGLQAGQNVVVSGQFLVDSEANLRASATRMGDMSIAPGAKP